MDEQLTSRWVHHRGRIWDADAQSVRHSNRANQMFFLDCSGRDTQGGDVQSSQVFTLHSAVEAT